jgi:hypothetical protein
MVRDLAVPHTHHIHTLKMDFAMRGSNSKKRTFVSPILSFVRRHTVAFCKLPVDFGVKVRKRLPHAGIQLAHTSLVWRCSRLRRVIDEIICEEFVEYIEFSLALNLLCVSAHNTLRDIRN